MTFLSCLPKSLENYYKGQRAGEGGHVLPAPGSQLSDLKDPLQVGKLRECVQEEGGGRVA